jgi:hypothetical protein
MALAPKAKARCPGCRGSASPWIGTCRALQNGDAAGAHRRIAATLADLADGVPAAMQRPAPAARYAGVPVLDRQGVVVGEVVRAAPDRLELALGGARDIWGFWDWRPQRVMAVAPDAAVLGPRRTVGKSFVVLPGADRRTATSN